MHVLLRRNNKHIDRKITTFRRLSWKTAEYAESRPFRAPHRRRDIAKYVVPYLLYNANGFELVFNRHDRNRMAELKLLYEAEFRDRSACNIGLVSGHTASGWSAGRQYPLPRVHGCTAERCSLTVIHHILRPNPTSDCAGRRADGQTNERPAAVAVATIELKL